MTRLHVVARMPAIAPDGFPAPPWPVGVTLHAGICDGDMSPAAARQLAACLVDAAAMVEQWNAAAAVLPAVWPTTADDGGDRRDR